MDFQPTRSKNVLKGSSKGPTHRNMCIYFSHDMINKGKFCLNPENQKFDLVALQLKDLLGVFSLFGAGVYGKLISLSSAIELK